MWLSLLVDPICSESLFLLRRGRTTFVIAAGQRRTLCVLRKQNNAYRCHILLQSAFSFSTVVFDFLADSLALALAVFFFFSLALRTASGFFVSSLVCVRVRKGCCFAHCLTTRVNWNAIDFLSSSAIAHSLLCTTFVHFFLCSAGLE